ncbi:MAG: TonB family protein [Bacteroidales bacterium]|nr:TonB family protein [Bacteroidales bacterium]
MKKLLLILLQFLFCLPSFSQDSIPINNVWYKIQQHGRFNFVVIEGDTMLVRMPTIPQFPGGEDSLISFIERNLKYPPKAVEDRIEGRVLVEFIVNYKGEITKVKVTEGVRKDLNKEAIRVTKMMPNWIPGTKYGYNASVTVELPILFKLTGG